MSLLLLGGTKVVASEAPSGWTEGPGPNAPAWSGKTIYTEEDFSSPLPESPSAVNAAGFRLTNGFGDAPGTDRIQYVEQDTPLGTRTVMRMNFLGQTETLTGAGQSTTPYEFSPFIYWNAAVYITGTWSGTVTFETSPDQVTWTATSLTAIALSGFTHSTGSSTTVNGLWAVDTGSGRQFVRAVFSSYTSGSAVVRVGVRGGQAPANFTGGTFTGNPTRIYQRAILRRSAGWSDGDNAGTKMFFFSQIAGKTNHYVAGRMNFAGLQVHTNVNYDGLEVAAADGEWWDTEQIITGGTAGGSDGTIQLWVNGVQVLNETAVPMFPADETPKFTDFFYDPTYGGGQRPSPFNQYIEYAYMYRESAP